MILVEVIYADNVIGIHIISSRQRISSTGDCHILVVKMGHSHLISQDHHRKKKHRPVPLPRRESLILQEAV